MTVPSTIGNGWAHTVCDPCFQELRPKQEPWRTPIKYPEKCCHCGKEHQSGIYLEMAPQDIGCRGKHT